METTELKESFCSLYKYIINSDDEEKMHVLGQLTKEMMMRTIDSNPSLAKEYIERLESVKWCNYLTDKEAEAIVAKMQPSPLWSRSAWNEAMAKMDWMTSDEPHYNANALFVTMSMITSDSGETLAKIAGIDTKDKCLTSESISDFKTQRLWLPQLNLLFQKTSKLASMKQNIKCQAHLQSMLRVQRSGHSQSNRKAILRHLASLTPMSFLPKTSLMCNIIWSFQL